VVKAVKVGDHMISVKIIRVGAAAGAFTVTQKSFETLVANTKAALIERKKMERKDTLTQIQTKWPKLTTTKSGLMYEVLKQGTGASPVASSKVVVNYTGTLLDGKVFDSTASRGKPATFEADRVIPGWTEALIMMKRGEKVRLVIPPELGYGVQGYPGVIPPNSFLVFEVELIDF
jgi:FKBP-type peptidyl-prolyl cis-trans isomerase